MKSIVVSKPGGPEELVLADVSDPVPGEGEVLVEVAGAGLNFIDTYQRSGLYPMEFPLTPGLEGAGTVLDVGAGVDGIEPRKRVAWASVLGSYAEKHVIPAAKAIPVPEGLDS